MPFDFAEIFDWELDVINFRRHKIREGEVAAVRDGLLPHEVAARARFAVPRAVAAIVADDTGNATRETVRVTDDSKLTGLALSGGGIRSASFCLGVLQALDALAEKKEPRLLDTIDYISAVSGGGYMATSLVAGLLQRDGSFPFAAELDEQESPEVQHLRDFSNFLAPNGWADYRVSIALVLRGLLVNAIIVLPVLLILAAITIASNPRVADLRTPDLFGIHLEPGRYFPLVIPGLEAFTIAVNFAIVAAVLMFLSAIVTSVTYRRGTLRSRERLGAFLGWLLVAVLAAALFEAQPFVLAGMMFAHDAAMREVLAGPVRDVLAGITVLMPPLAPFFEAQWLAFSGAAAAGRAAAADGATSGPVQDALAAIGSIVPALAAVLTPAAALLIAAAQKLAKLARASLGEATWSATFKKYSSKAVLYLAALIVPLLLWVAYIYLSYWALRVSTADGCGPATPVWLQDMSQCGTVSVWPIIRWIGPLGAMYVAAAVLLAAICLLIGPNSNSLHRLYRDRLSRAFLFERENMGDRNAPSSVDTWKFSSLKPRNPDGSWLMAAAYAPYLLTNTAINLEGSRELNKRGRNADTFIFSPLAVGSWFTGYVPTGHMEATVRDLGLASAMATSGAAASANMGRGTVKVLTASLTLLNIRLGYWLANPFRMEELRPWWRAPDWVRRNFKRWVASVGTWYFASETLGLINEKRLNVYLTDGGHIENLGIYELLRRRCKVIVAVDAEADPDMTFPSLVNLQVMARIDLGVRIDLPWQALQASGVGVTASALYGPKGAPGRKGPHAAIGTINYGDSRNGVLIYIKASLSGDENDYILDYKRRNSTFPHESTVDQFFNEEQFEAYRALGFHAARGLLTGADNFAKPSSLSAGWQAEVRSALALLNVPPAMITKIMTHI